MSNDTTITAAPSTEPVTTSGWYDLTDGRVGRFEWRAGQLSQAETVNSWADVELDPSVPDAPGGSADKAIASLEEVQS